MMVFANRHCMLRSVLGAVAAMVMAIVFAGCPATAALYEAVEESVETTEDEDEGGPTFEYAIGDVGPAGGHIFYIDVEDEHSWTYLEAAPQITELTGISWGGDGTDINGSNSAAAPELLGVGTGQSNTTAIVLDLGDNGGTDYFAMRADDLNHNGYDDWFLPSRDEVAAMYQNLHQNALGGFESDTYFSSSEVDSSSAHVVQFNSGILGTDTKNFINAWARAVRSF